MRVRPERLASYAGAAALGTGALGMVFERADPSVTPADPDAFAAWARRHHRAMAAQSGVYLAGTAPLLLFFAGLGRSVPAPAGPAVLGGGATWVAFQGAAQVAQLATARAARDGAGTAVVAGLGERTATQMARGNVALAVALAGTAVDPRLPRWLRRLSAVTAAAHALPAGVRVLRGRPAGAPAEYLPYPLFVAWLVGVVVAVGRR